jgi:hypothetical protein
MSSSTPTLEDRLARYRPVLEGAIADRTSSATSDRPFVDRPLIELDREPADDRHAWSRSRVLVGASAVVLIGGLGVIIATRNDPATAPASSAVPLDTVAATTIAAVEGSVVVGTTPDTIVEGSGQTPACPDSTDTIGTGTLYLGGPASDQNLATKGFIFSLPQGPTPVDVAIRAIGLPVIGLECSITGSPTSDANLVRVTARPPTVPTPLQLDVTIAEHDGIVGVTAVTGSTTFEVNNTGATPTLQLLDGVPASTVRVAVRFKKGDDVWEITADPTVRANIALSVPGGETDKFASDPVDWVLFTLIDANEHIVGAGGALI